jgi:hypothetical protein
MSYFARLGWQIVPFFVLTMAFTLVGGGALGQGQEKGLKKLEWSHAFDLACRKKGENDITPKTTRWGVEAFRDNNTAGGIGLYISETGSFGLAPNFATIQVPVNPSKNPKHFTGLDLPARKAGVVMWDKMTGVHSMEVFRDPNTDNFVYITEVGNIAAADGTANTGAPGKDPKWVHSVDLAVRKGGVKDFDGAAKFGIEVYADGTSNGLVYITENGLIAVIPNVKNIAPPDPKAKVKPVAPEWLHGLDLSCRRYDEVAFTKDTRKFGVEVYHDLHTNNLIFISETGSIAVTPTPANVVAPTAKAKEPVWTHGLNVKCRKFGEAEFSATTRAFGAEVFRDENLGVTIYINELGNIAAIATK